MKSVEVKLDLITKKVEKVRKWRFASSFRNSHFLRFPSLNFAAFFFFNMGSSIIRVC